jgi:AcrR family transcriptional regulator
MIVEAASRYFAEVGFSGPTRDLARRLGVTQPLLYKYFASKAELTEAVFDHISLGRLRPHWPEMLADQTQPLKPRLVAFYAEYTAAIFTYEWLRIFMFAGLAGDGLNRRYLEHLSDLLLMPLLAEMRRRAKGDKPDIEDLLSLHGAVIYLGIRKFIYQSGAPDDFMPVIERNVTRFLDAFGLE